MVNTPCTYKLYQVVEFMFRQWTWNLDRICITFPESSITLVPWPLSWTFLQAEQFSSKRNQYFIKINIFWLGKPEKTTGKTASEGRIFTDFSSTFEASIATLGGQTPKMWPDLRNTGSWGAVHKTRGRLNHSKGPKPPIYYAPMRGSRSKTENQGKVLDTSPAACEK